MVCFPFNFNYLEKNGGAGDTQRNASLPPHQVTNTFGFSVIPPYRDHDFLRQKYLVERLSIKQISTLTASSKEAIRKGLLRAGVQLRKHGQHHGRPAQPRFGKKVIKGKEMDYKQEQRVVDVITKLRSRNVTLRQVAQTLSQLGVPTKCRGKGWHPEMVRRVLASSASLATTTP